MPTEFLREIPGPAGPLEALLDLPEGEPRAVAVFGHPHPLHGGTLHTKGVYQAAKGMARIGVAALRFNFRGVGRSQGTGRLIGHLLSSVVMNTFLVSVKAVSAPGPSSRPSPDSPKPPKGVQ